MKAQQMGPILYGVLQWELGKSCVVFDGGSGEGGILESELVTNPSVTRMQLFLGNLVREMGEERTKAFASSTRGIQVPRFQSAEDQEMTYALLIWHLRTSGVRLDPVLLEVDWEEAAIAMGIRYESIRDLMTEVIAELANEALEVLRPAASETHPVSSADEMPAVVIGFDTEREEPADTKRELAAATNGARPD